MGLTLVTAPPFQPLTVEELKAQINMIDDTDSDTFLTECIVDGTDRVSADIGKQLITATYDYTIEEIPDSGIVELPLAPLQSVTSVKYYDEDDDLQTMDADDYRVYADTDPGTIYFINPPSHYTRHDAITIRFVAGYGNAEDVPGPIKRGIRLLAADFFRNREATTEGPLAPIPTGIDYLLAPYRMLRFK